MLSRRHFLIATAAAPAAFSTRAFGQDQKVLQVFIDGDTNISNWWNDIIKPAFEAAHPIPA